MPKSELKDLKNLYNKLNGCKEKTLCKNCLVLNRNIARLNNEDEILFYICHNSFGQSKTVYPCDRSGDYRYEYYYKPYVFKYEDYMAMNSCNRKTLCPARQKYQDEVLCKK
jgi:hypothetical protein